MSNILVTIETMEWWCELRKYRVVYHTFYTPGHLGLVRLIKNISNKLFEKVLGEWAICAAEKPLIKFGGKRKT